MVSKNGRGGSYLLIMSVDRKLAELTGVVYFIQGALGLSAVAFPLFLRDAGLEIKDITALSALASTPWLVKIVLAALSDEFPVFRYRRKTYIILSAVVSAAGWWALAFSPFFIPLVTVFMMMANLGIAATDVVTDGLIVEHSTETTTQTYQSISWASRSVGAIASGVAGGWLAATVGYRTVFALTGILPLLALLIAFRLDERRVGGRPFADILRSLWAPIVKSLRLILGGELRWFCLLLIVGTVSTSFVTPLFFFFKEDLGFEKTFLGVLQSLSSVGAVIGCGVYYACMKKVPLRRALTVAIVLDVTGTLLCLLIFNEPSAIALAFLTGVMGFVTLLPLLAAAAEMAHGTGIEGSLFAILMSVRNAGVIGFNYLGGQIHDAVGLRPLIFISAAIAATGLFIIRKLKHVPA